MYNLWHRSWCQGTSSPLSSWTGRSSEKPSTSCSLLLLSLIVSSSSVLSLHSLSGISSNINKYLSKLMTYRGPSWTNLFSEPSVFLIIHIWGSSPQSSWSPWSLAALPWSPPCTSPWPSGFKKIELYPILESVLQVLRDILVFATPSSPGLEGGEESLCILSQSY